MQKKNVNWVTVVLAVVACGVAASSGLALASGTGTRGVTRVEESTVRVADDIQIKQKGGSQVIVAHITVQPGGHTPWHYHPGPHIVTVKTGTVEIYETDCGPPQELPGRHWLLRPGRDAATPHPHPQEPIQRGDRRGGDHRHPRRRPPADCRRRPPAGALLLVGKDVHALAGRRPVPASRARMAAPVGKFNADISTSVLPGCGTNAVDVTVRSPAMGVR